MVCYLDQMDSPIGLIYLAAIDEGLVYCATSRKDGKEVGAWLDRNLPDYAVRMGSNPILKEAKAQLTTYFNGTNRVLDVPLKLIGTPFRQKVWQALITIPYGETRTYGQIAAQIGRPKGPRAVGQANHHNPISYFVP